MSERRDDRAPVRARRPLGACRPRAIGSVRGLRDWARRSLVVSLNGSMGTEIVSVVIAEPGSYRVRVTSNGSGAAGFEIAGSWMSLPALT